ncbi:MAG: hydrogenase maturation nickel metallochaperone HypA [bacterium]
MHEVSIAENIIEIIKAEMPKHNLTRIDSIKIRIGDMSHIMPDALIFAFELLSEGTQFENAKIIIEKIPTKGRCRNCGNEFIMDDILDNCPKCGGVYIDIISGKELEILEFEGH